MKVYEKDTRTAPDPEKEEPTIPGTPKTSYPTVNEDGIHIGLVKNITNEGFTLVMTKEQAKYLDWCIHNADGSGKVTLKTIKLLPEKWRLWANAHFHTTQTGWDAFHTCADALEELLNELVFSSEFNKNSDM